MTTATRKYTSSQKNQFRLTPEGTVHMSIYSKTHGHFTVLIDLEDMPQVQKYVWGIRKHKSGGYYATTYTGRVDGRQKTKELPNFLMDPHK
jgi:hypothetical protein